jgi:hypothetical protein
MSMEKTTIVLYALIVTEFANKIRNSTKIMQQLVSNGHSFQNSTGIDDYRVVVYHIMFMENEFLRKYGVI